jgi:protein SCO1/2
MMKNWIIVALLGMTVAACGDQPASFESNSEPAAAPEAAQEPTAPDTETREYPIRGQVVSVNPEAKSIILNHEKIEGFMEAMTMPYPVPEDADIQKMKPGDTINAKVFYNRAESKYWLSGVVVE